MKSWIFLCYNIVKNSKKKERKKQWGSLKGFVLHMLDAHNAENIKLNLYFSIHEQNFNRFILDKTVICISNLYIRIIFVF